MLRFDGRPGKRETNDYTAQIAGDVLGRYRTKQTVIVIKMPESFIVDTVAGPKHGGPGDYLLIAEPGGAMWPCSADRIHTYEKIEDIVP